MRVSTSAFPELKLAYIFFNLFIKKKQWRKKDWVHTNLVVMLFITIGMLPCPLNKYA